MWTLCKETVTVTVTVTVEDEGEEGACVMRGDRATEEQKTT